MVELELLESTRRSSDYSVLGKQELGTITWLVFDFLPDLGVTNLSRGLVPSATGETGRGINRGSTSIGIEVGFLVVGRDGFFVDLHAIFPTAASLI